MKSSVAAKAVSIKSAEMLYTTHYMKRSFAAPVALKSLFSRVPKWRLGLLVILALLMIYSLLFWRLGSLTGGYSAGEASVHVSSTSLSTIIKQPIDLPYKAAVYLLNSVGQHSLLMQRAISAVLGVGAIIFFWFIIRAQYNWHISLTATGLFAASSGLLHAARLGIPVILQMSAMLFFAMALFYHMQKHKTLGLYGVAIFLAVLLYIPGLIWFELCGLIIMRRQLISMVRKMKNVHVFLLPILYLMLITPLVLAVSKDTDVLKQILGLPSILPSPETVAKNLVHIAAAFGFRAYYPTDISLQGIAILSYGEMALFLLGLYEVMRRPRLKANYFIVAALLLTSILIALDGSVTYIMLVPLVYIVIAAGIRHLHRIWREVFPRNPIAHTLARVCLIVLISFCALYQLRSYFVAWPHASETKQTFHIKS